MKKLLLALSAMALLTGVLAACSSTPEPEETTYPAKTEQPAPEETPIPAVWAIRFWGLYGSWPGLNLCTRRANMPSCVQMCM